MLETDRDSLTKTSARSRIHEVTEDRHGYAKLWKQRTGGKIIGIFCTYAPMEMVYAAGMLPVRILGGHEPQDVTEPYIHGTHCSWCRDCLSQGLRGRYDYLDGIVKARCCMHMRNAFLAWQKYVPVEFDWHISMPGVLKVAGAKTYLVKELERFKKSLEEWTGKPITDDNLRHGIDVCNANRSLLKQVYATQKAIDPPISGRDAAEVALTSQIMDKAEHTQLLKDILPKLVSGREKYSGIRLMIIGTEVDDLELFSLIESVGGLVVADDHCTGSRDYWNNVIVDGDLLAAIADRYIERPPCPTKDVQDRRWPHILQMAKDYNVQGAILLQQKWCDSFEFDIPSLTEVLKANGIPSLHLEYDTALNEGPFKMRIQAFLEMLELEIL